ncbi:MAG: ferric reductase-like transmembrane domain-containing protein [Jannaschia sp.]
MPSLRAGLVWTTVLAAIALPLGIAAASPFLAYRDPVYIAAGFAGIVGLGLMLLQPLLVGGRLPGVSGGRGRRVHAWTGAVLMALIVLHVGGLWLTSPPDVIDALTFTSPTPFSVWGVVAMWAAFGAALLAALRRRLPLRVWRLGHSDLVTIVVSGTVLHAVLIQGTMGLVSKVVLCGLVVAALVKVFADRRVWLLLKRRRT